MIEKIWIDEGKEGCEHEFELEEGTFCCIAPDCHAEYVEDDNSEISPI